MKKKIDIENYNDFIDAGFIECKKCGFAFDPEFFKNHDCFEMNKPRSDKIIMPKNKV